MYLRGPLGCVSACVLPPLRWPRSRSVVCCAVRAVDSRRGLQARLWEPCLATDGATNYCYIPCYFYHHGIWSFGIISCAPASACPHVSILPERSTVYRVRERSPRRVTPAPPSANTRGCSLGRLAAPIFRESADRFGGGPQRRRYGQLAAQECLWAEGAERSRLVGDERRAPS